MNPILPNADDLRGGIPMNTDDELDILGDFILGLYGMKLAAAEVKLANFIHKSNLHRAIEELEQLLLLIGHSALTRRNIHDRITALQAELQQAEKEQ